MIDLMPPGVAGAPARVERRPGMTGRLRSRVSTTPGLLRLLSAVVTGAIALMWGVTFAATTARQDAVGQISRNSGPSFAAAQRIHANLSGADATVAAAFLVGGVEPAAQRAAYDRAIAAATADVIGLARAGGPPEIQAPLTVLASRIPVYTGLVNTARADNRVGHVVGAAYLRDASKLMNGTILPAADTLAAIDASRIDGGYARATRGADAVGLAAAAAAAVGALVVIQWLLYRRTHRVFNLALVAATLLAATAAGLALGAFAAQRARLIDGRDSGFVPATIVAEARMLGLRAWGDESLSLIARGDGAALDADAVAVAARLGYDPEGRPTGSGVLPAAAALGGPDAATRAGLAGEWQAYLAASLQVRTLVAGVGRFQDAVSLALGDAAIAFGRYDAAADAALTASQQRFTQRLGAAGDRLGGLVAVVTALLVVATVSGIAGLQTRINEYR